MWFMILFVGCFSLVRNCGLFAFREAFSGFWERFDFPAFSVGGGHFNWGTICPPVGTEFWIALSEFFDIVLDVGGVGQCKNDVVDGKIPALFLRVPCAADLLFFEE